MTGKEIIGDLMNRYGMNNEDMAERLNLSRSAVWARLDKKQSDNMTVRTLQNMANVLGHEVVVVAKNSMATTEGYRIGDSYNEK